MLTDADVNSIISALPDDVQQEKALWLGCILREWARIELPRHLKYKANVFTKEEREHLRQTHSAAHELTTALNSLNRRVQRVLEWQMAKNLAQQRQIDAQDTIEEVCHQLRSLQAVASEVAKAAGEAVTALTRGRGRPRETASHLIMRDLAELFLFATGRVATRLVRSNDHSEYKSEYGDFWNFARAAWIAVFKSEDRLISAIRTWDDARKKYNERSALIANISFRHPEWGIFGGER